MAAPKKPDDTRKSYRGYFYLPPDLQCRMDAESKRRGGASRSDIVRWALMKTLPPCDIQVKIEDG